MCAYSIPHLGLATFQLPNSHLPRGILHLILWMEEKILDEVKYSVNSGSRILVKLEEGKDHHSFPLHQPSTVPRIEECPKNAVGWT